MDWMSEIIAESVSGGFWKFCGYWVMIVVILGIPAKVLIFTLNRLLRYFTMRKLGYPPNHCDADGDFKE